MREGLYYRNPGIGTRRTNYCDFFLIFEIEISGSGNSFLVTTREITVSRTHVCRRLFGKSRCKAFRQTTRRMNRLESPRIITVKSLLVFFFLETDISLIFIKYSVLHHASHKPEIKILLKFVYSIQRINRFFRCIVA